MLTNSMEISKAMPPKCYPGYVPESASWFATIITVHQKPACKNTVKEFTI